MKTYQKLTHKLTMKQITAALTSSAIISVSCVLTACTNFNLPELFSKQSAATTQVSTSTTPLKQEKLSYRKKVKNAHQDDIFYASKSASTDVLVANLM